MIKYADAARDIIINDCFPSNPEHELCELLFLNHFGTNDVMEVFGDPNWITATPPIEDERLFVINAVSQPSPDGAVWSEVHHIVPRGAARGEAQYLPQRAISHELHSLVEAGAVPNVDACRPIFHCVHSATEWAQNYANRRAAQLPTIPTEILFQRRVISAYHYNMGQRLAEAQAAIDTVTMKELHSYVWLLRETSWSQDGAARIHNICPSEVPPSEEEWAVSIMDEVNGWYSLSEIQKVYLRRLAYIAGPYGVKLIDSGVPFSLLKSSSENYRAINGLYSLCLQSEDFSDTARVFTEAMAENNSLSAIGDELSAIARENRQPSDADKLYYVNNNYVVLVTVYPADEFRRNTSNFAPLSAILEDLAEYLED